MRGALGPLLAVLASLARPAHGRPLDAPGLAVPTRILAMGPGLGALLRGPEVRPGTLIVTEPDGRMRTLELDDLAPLRLRITIPF